MKAKKAELKENQLICRYGKARFYQQKRAQSEWESPNKPAYKPNWWVRFNVGGETWEESAGPLYPVVDGLEGGVKDWAVTRLKTRQEAMRKGKLEQMESLVKGPRSVMLDELGRVYLVNVPPGKSDYTKNWQRLKAIFTEITGRQESAIEVSDTVFTRANLLGWVRMRQEHWRRGWAKKGGTPADGWARLRRDLAANKLPEGTTWPRVKEMEASEELMKVLGKGVFPGVDKTTEMECNTTIKTYLRCAKAVFANAREYLVGLELPELSEFLEFSVDLRSPEGHREIEVGTVESLQKDALRLQTEEPKVWAWDVIVSWTGARPVTIKALKGDALTVMPDKSGLIILPAAKGGVPVRVPIDAAAVQALLAVRTDESLLGARHKTEADEIWRAYNGWLTKHGVTGTLKSYVKRHGRLQQWRDEHGLEAAAAGGGHRTTKMAERKYTQGTKVMPMMAPVKAAS